MSRLPEGCTVACVVGQDEGGAVHLGDDRRAGHDVPGPQLGPLVDPGGDLLAADVDRVLRHQRPGRVAVALGQRHRGDVGPGPGDRGPRVDQLVVHAEQEGEQPVVLGVEALPEGLQRARPGSASQAASTVDRDLEALAVVADVDLVADGLLLARQALGGQPLPGVVGQLAQDADQVGPAQVGEPAQHRPGGLVAAAGGGVAQGAQQAGRRRHDHRPGTGERGPARWRAAGRPRRRRPARSRGGRSPAAPTPAAGRRACSR